MALVDGNGGGLSAADVAAVMGNGNGGFGWGGDSAWWIIILLLFANNGFGNGYGNGGAMPFMYNDVQRGFDQQSVMAGLSGIQTAITSGFGNGEVAATNRQMANMQQLFGVQTALDTRMDTILSNLQQCCCDQRAATADLKYTIANEANATRAAGQANTQTIMDKLCQLEMDGMRQNYETQISGLRDQLTAVRTQLAAVNNAASQNAQTAAIMADNAAQTVALEQYLNPTPVPAYTVPNPNCCRGNNLGFAA